MKLNKYIFFDDGLSCPSPVGHKRVQICSGQICSVTDSKLTLKKTREAILSSIDKAIQKGQWDGSLFLRNILKQLQELRNYVEQELSPNNLEDALEASKAVDLAEQKEGYQRVYIALYQANGSLLDRWFLSIKMLVGYAINRPIYKSLEHVEKMIREKKTSNDAYVVVWIKKTDIIFIENPLKDRWGNSLLTIREGSFHLENVIEFVHNEIHYRLTNNGLVRIPSA